VSCDCVRRQRRPPANKAWRAHVAAMVTRQVERVIFSPPLVNPHRTLLACSASTAEADRKTEPQLVIHSLVRSVLPM
jgi:hypothetical protein